MRKEKNKNENNENENDYDAEFITPLLKNEADYEISASEISQEESF